MVLPPAGSKKRRGLERGGVRLSPPYLLYPHIIGRNGNSRNGGKGGEGYKKGQKERRESGDYNFFFLDPHPAGADENLWLAAKKGD